MAWYWQHPKFLAHQYLEHVKSVPSSFTKAMFTCLKVFSNNFAASATSGDETSTKLSQKVE